MDVAAVRRRGWHGNGGGLTGYAHWSLTTLFSSGIVMSFEPNSTPSCVGGLDSQIRR